MVTREFQDPLNLKPSANSPSIWPELRGFNCVSFSAAGTLERRLSFNSVRVGCRVGRWGHPAVLGGARQGHNPNRDRRKEKAVLPFLVENSTEGALPSGILVRSLVRSAAVNCS